MEEEQYCLLAPCLSMMLVVYLVCDAFEILMIEKAENCPTSQKVMKSPVYS